MRFSVIILLLAFSSSALGQSPQEWIDRAVRAHGGVESLAKMRAVTQTALGRMVINGTDVNANREVKWALPDRLWCSVNFKFGGIDRKTIVAINGLSGWHQLNQEPPTDLNSAAFDEISDEAYVYWLTTINALTQKGFTFSAATERPVHGQEAVGIKVVRPGRPDVTLYFNKANALLVKAEFRSQVAGVAMNKEFLLAEHKPFSGVKLPTKVTEMRDNVRVCDWTITDYKFVDKFNPEDFKKPGAK